MEGGLRCESRNRGFAWAGSPTLWGAGKIVNVFLFTILGCYRTISGSMGRLSECIIKTGILQKSVR